MNLEQLNELAHANRFYCDRAQDRIALEPRQYCNHQFFANGILVFDMDSLEVWSFENEEKAAEFIRNYNSISDADFNAYLETILWSETGDDGEPLDASYQFSDFDGEQLKHQRKECESFIAENRSVIDWLLERDYEMSQIMHDFWLTRNRHGVGFWEPGDYPKAVGIALTESANRYGEVSVYVGDDGVLYFS